MAEQKTEKAMRYSDEELSFIKSLFAEDDTLLKVLRKVFLQGDLTAEEIKTVRHFNTDSNSFKLLQKTLMPEIDHEAPLFQVVDLYSNIDTKNDSMEKAYPLILARDLMCDYLAQQFDVLADKKPKTGIVLSKLARAGSKEPLQAFVDLSARNTIMTHVEFQLFNLKLLAGTKKETVEQTKARLQANSNK